MYYVYILKSLKDGKRYIGYTFDLNQRLKQHNEGRNKSVKGRGLLKLFTLKNFPIKLRRLSVKNN